MANEANFFGNFLQSFAQGQQLAGQKKLQDDERKAKLKLIDFQLQKAEQTQTAQDQFFGQFQGEEGVPGKSLTEILSDPQGQMSALKSGLVKFGDIGQAKQQEMMTGLLERLGGAGGAGQGGVTPLVTMTPRGPNVKFQPDRVTFQDTGTELIPVNQRGERVTDISPIKKNIGALKEVDIEINQRGAKAVLSRLTELSKEIFKDDGFFERLKSAPQHMIESFTQSNPKIALLDSYIKGTLAPMIRSLGEKGSLSDTDVKRAMALMPTMFPIPDSKEVAMGKIKQINDILDRVRKKPSAPSGSGNVIDFSELP